MAQVQMDLAELDKLRQDLKEKDNTISEKNNVNKELEKEIALIKADKRVVKVTKTIKEKYDLWKDCTIALDSNRLMHDLVNIQRLYGENHRYSPNYHHIENQLLGVIRNSLMFHPIADFNPVPERTEFVNFDDVKQELRKIVEEELYTEISEARSTKALFNQKLADSTQNYRNKIESIESINKQEVKIYKEEVELLNKKILELETGKKELNEMEALKEDIKILTENLNKEKSKKWYHKLFNI